MPDGTCDTSRIPFSRSCASNGCSFFHIPVVRSVGPARNAPFASVVRARVELDTQPPGIAADALAHCSAVFADPRGEHDRVESAERACKRAELAADPIDIEVDRFFGVRLAARKQRSHVARDSGNSQQT